MIRLHHRTCNLCEAMCGIELEINAGPSEEIIKIRGDKHDAFSRGYLCLKGEALADIHTDKNRLKRPVKRTDSGWKEISWKEALDHAAKNFRRLQKNFGNDSVASYIGNPNVHNYGSLFFLQPLLRGLRSRNRFAATSVDQLPHHMVAYFLFGHQLLIPIPDIDRTDFMIILGGNPVVSRGSMMTAPDVTTRIKAIRDRGGKVLLIDPRRSETAAVVDAHHFIRPGTDAGLMLAILHVIFAEGLASGFRQTHLVHFTDGIDTLESLVKEFSPEKIASIVEIEASTIREMARGFAKAKSAVCYGRVGVSTQEFGTLTQWLITALNIITGNLDRPGGAMFTTPAFDPLPHISKGHFKRWVSRVRGLAEFAGELPVSVLAEEILTPGTGQIKGLLTVAGNPVLSTPNGPQLEKALSQLDYMVAVDFYINETTRFANLILPPTSSLEHENYDAAFHVLAVRNTTKFSPVCFPSEKNTRHDWQILSALHRRLEMRWSSPLSILKQAAFRFVTPERILALGLRFGPYGSGKNIFGGGLTLSKVKNQPHGIDLGPLKPRLPQRLFTKSKRINIVPDIFTSDIARFRQRYFDVVKNNQSESFDMLLIGRRQVRTNNSWMGHIPRLSTGRPTCTAFLHPDDATKRGIKTGDHIRVSSRVGSIEIPAIVVDSIMPGVISIPHGFGHGREGVKLDFNDSALGVSVNDIADDHFLDALSGNAALNGVPVRIGGIARVEGAKGNLVQ